MSNEGALARSLSGEDCLQSLNQMTYEEGHQCNAWNDRVCGKGRIQEKVLNASVATKDISSVTMPPNMRLRPLARWGAYRRQHGSCSPFSGPGGWDFDFDAKRPFYQIEQRQDMVFGSSKANKVNQLRPKRIAWLSTAVGDKAAKAAKKSCLLLRPKVKPKPKNC